MVAFEPNCVNHILDIIGFNSLRVGSIHIFFSFLLILFLSLALNHKLPKFQNLIVHNFDCHKFHMSLYFRIKKAHWRKIERYN